MGMSMFWTVRAKPQIVALQQCMKSVSLRLQVLGFKTEVRVLMLGLDNAGKTTILSDSAQLRSLPVSQPTRCVGTHRPLLRCRYAEAGRGGPNGTDDRPQHRDRDLQEPDGQTMTTVCSGAQHSFGQFWACPY